MKYRITLAHKSKLYPVSHAQETPGAFNCTQATSGSLSNKV